MPPSVQAALPHCDGRWALFALGLAGDANPLLPIGWGTRSLCGDAVRPPSVCGEPPGSGKPTGHGQEVGCQRKTLRQPLKSGCRQRAGPSKTVTSGWRRMTCVLCTAPRRSDRVSGTSGIRQVNCAIRFRPITTDPDILRRSSGTCQGSNDLLADLADNTCRVPADSVSIAPRGHSRVWDTSNRSAAQPTPE